MRPRPRALLAAPALLALLALVACGNGDDSDGGATSAAADPTAAFDPAATTIDGGELTAASLEDTDTVLWFWAPWCTTCRGEAPDVVAAAEAFDGEVEVIGVASRGDVPEMEDFVSDTGTEGLRHVVDVDGAIWSSFEVVTQPAFAFLDDTGEVEVVVGALGEQGLTEQMQALLET